MTAVSPQVPALTVYQVMSVERLMDRCRQIGAVFTDGGTERFRIADHLPAGARHPHDYDEAGLRAFCSSRMH